MSAGRSPIGRAKTAADKRRSILDAAVRVFARQGFHACRVADIADEAGVAYGLVYHYFASKDEILDTLFLERWAIMLETIRQVDAQRIPAREKLAAIASFIIDSYSHNPDLMKVIIVEVTRAANSFGQTHLAQIREAFTLISEIVTSAQAAHEFRPEISAEFAAIAFYGAIEQVLTGWIFGLLPDDEEHYEQAKRLIVETVCGGLDSSPRGAPRGARHRGPRRLRAHRIEACRLGAIDCDSYMENDVIKRLMWSGLLAGIGALSSVIAHRAAARLWLRLFDEEPPE